MGADVDACWAEEGEKFVDVGFHYVEVDDHGGGVEGGERGAGGGVVHFWFGCGKRCEAKRCNKETEDVFEELCRLGFAVWALRIDSGVVVL